uniref:Eukaryotic translation initiation factor 2D n=1 Tax=Geotrypetes seraphini TaxID=260995 RepID=A0A6P8NYC8_GEOSA|nr:eukaryotic translation initiation factor 2D isoform X2 [Geotrypetes seraphini]
MFCKAFRVKSNTVMKGSDRRKLRTDVVTAFPALRSEELSEFIPSKEELNLVKLYTHKGEAVTVYVQNRNPILFEVEGRLYPTVYTLWSYSDLLPAFVTWPPVLQKLAGGADLMLPGVVLPPSGLPQVQQGNICAITLVGNRAPVAVGIATMSTAEMLGAGMKGKGVAVLHTYTDQLWALGEKCLLPIIASLELETTKPGNASEEEERQATCLHDPSPAPCLQNATESLSLKEAENDLMLLPQEDLKNAEDSAMQPPQDDVEEPRSSQELMDELLLQCFFQALKSRVKKLDLPLLTSTFLRNYMFSCCPEGKQMDIKKSSYKKLSKFLQCMQNRKILQVKELSRGVESIVDVDWKHPDFVTINPILCDCALEKSEQSDVAKLKWEDLLSRCMERLQPFHQLSFHGQEPMIRKGSLDPIDIIVAQRASNKKVTLIKNLELYGLDPHSVAAVLQQRVQASATVTALPGSKDRAQVQIQGNQVTALGKLLLEEYSLPRKYIQGLEKAPKSNKKK